MKKLIKLGMLSIIFLASCNTAPNLKEEIVEPKLVLYDSAEIKQIIYSMYLPINMLVLPEGLGNEFNSEILAPKDSLSEYTNPEQIAVLLGILSVDLSYLKILGHNPISDEYYSAVGFLSEQLQIPEIIFKKSGIKLEQIISEKDSISTIMQNVYFESDQFLRQNGNEILATLSSVGRWIEAMYLCVNIYEADKDNHALARKILQQKTTLNTLYLNLRNHQGSLLLTSYQLMLKKLYSEYEKIEFKLVSEKSATEEYTEKEMEAFHTQILYDITTLNSINKIVVQIREELIKNSQY